MQLHRSGNIYDGMGTYTANITVPDLAANLVPVQKNGYYPLFLTEAEANLWSAGNGSSHTHEFGGVTYYMPNGLTLGVDQFHGDYQLAVQYSMDDATGLNAFNGATFGESAEGRIAASLPNGDSGMYPDSPIALGSQYTLSLWFKNLRDRSQAPAGAMQFDGTHNGGVHNGSFNGTGATAASYNIFIYTNDELGAWSSASSWRSSGYTMTHLTHAGWHHLVASYDNGTMTYYVDGIQAGNSISFTNIDSIKVLGTWSDLGDRCFAEMVDDVRLHNRAMDADEVAYWYAETTVVDPAGPQPVTLTSTDSYGDGWNGNVLTITNSDTGVEAASYTLADGYGETVQISPDNDANYSWSLGGGSYIGEVGVTAVDAGGNTLISISEGSPTSGAFTLGTPPVLPSVSVDQPQIEIFSAQIGDVLTTTVDLPGS